MHRHTGRTHPLAPSRACLLYIIQCTHCDRKRIDVPKIETVKVENYVDGSLSLAPSSLMIWHFEIVSLSLLYSTYFFFLFLQIYIIYIYIYIVLDIVWSKVYIRQCMIPLVIFLISYFCSVVSIIRHIRFVVWQFVHRTPRYDLFSSVALFRISYLFPPHRSPLCMQYIIWYRVLFFFEIFVWINHVPHVME
jgi:hypothetical protein